MPDPQVAPYGAWASPITIELLTAKTIGLAGLQLDGNDLYWIESRATEAGRNVLVRRAPDGLIADVTPPPFNVRTRVHEYGGGAALVADGVIYFSHFPDQRLYRVLPGGEPTPLTAEEALRYADAVLDRSRHRLICVCEDHTVPGQEARNYLATVDLTNGLVQPLVTGHDFFAAPRLSPDGSQLAWLTWDHPQMPWDGTELWVAAVHADGTLGPAQLVAGGREESVLQPEWSPEGELYFISDRTGWWNLYRRRGGEIEPLHSLAAEFGNAPWVFGLSSYAFESAQRLVCSFIQDGRGRLALLDTGTLAFEPLELPYTEFYSLRAAPGAVFFIAGSPTESWGLIQLELATRQLTVVRHGTELTLDPACVSLPQALEFPTTGGATAHAFFYPPRNADFVAPPGERPPLLVFSHGGPTGATSAVLAPRIQYWTSRGFAVLDVDYGGSTGYGRAYRERLKGQWGLVDVDDCINAARYVVAQGWADGARTAIRGGSAGGYTTLCALTFHDFFKAGCSLFGIGDLEALARDTHKFESRYLDGMVGPYPAQRDLYLARSPIHHVDRLNCPLLLLQGADDQVVPPNQAEMMAAAVRAKGLPVACLLFEGEGHGFRRAETIKRALEAELYFYGRVFGFTPADPLEPIPIENL